ncbi:MAG: hypothetical protein OEY56_07830 [Cyclobacteriaceae bacterium]|nr:hypothetical protein [Cyclobacteriaceae bacterium]
MNNVPLRNEIGNLERKLRLLLSEHQKLKEDLSFYREENEELRTKIKGKEKELAHFQNKDKISKIVGNMTAGGEDSKELKIVLDQYIKEIDKCIAHLSEA